MVFGCTCIWDNFTVWELRCDRRIQMLGQDVRNKYRVSSMGEAIDILPNEDIDAIRLKTNLNVWLIYNVEIFMLTYETLIENVVENVHDGVTFFYWVWLKEYVKNIDAPDLIFVEASGGWAQKMNCGCKATICSWKRAWFIFGRVWWWKWQWVIKNSAKTRCFGFSVSRYIYFWSSPLLKKTAAENRKLSGFTEKCSYLSTLKGGMGRQPWRSIQP